MSDINFHPDTHLLMDYSSGSLDRALSISVAVHLHFCKECKERSLSLSDIGGQLLSEVEPASVLSDTLRIVLSRIEDPEYGGESGSSGSFSTASESETLPPLVKRLLPEQGPDWKFLSPSLRVAKLAVGEQFKEVALHRIKAGGKTPTHDHRGQEITVVLKGSFSDDNGVYHEGDFLLKEPGDIHTPVATANEECICLSVLAAPIRMVGGFKRLLNPFLSFSPA